jgi:tRNA modification GTPase
MTEPTSVPETIAACLTPAGPGAIAAIGVRGPAAWEIARKLVRRRNSVQPALPEDAKPGQFWLGRLGGEIADECVVTLKRPAPVPCVEIHCHGGQEAVRFILETLAQEGAVIRTWQEWLRDTADALNGFAAVALAHAPTLRTASILLDQHQGAFAQHRDRVLAALDAGQADLAQQLLAELNRHITLGRRLTEPWRVAVLGAPNVGKSSLVNALAGFQRSVVAPTPGTTRDVVTHLTAFAGWPVELADTAGLRADTEELEAEGVRRAQATAADADLCLWVLDASAPPVWPDFEHPHLHYVINKCDLSPAWNTGEAAGGLQVSALTGTGVPELCQALGSWLVPDPPEPRAAVPFTPELCAACERGLELLETGDLAGAREVLVSEQGAV